MFYKKSKFKSIKKKDLREFLAKHHGKLVRNDYADYVNYYECDDNMLIVENTKAMNITLFFDRMKFYEQKEKIKEWQQWKPYKEKQDIIIDIESNRLYLLKELYETLNIKRKNVLLNDDIILVNSKLKKYRYENAIKNLHLNLIVFMGECVKEKRGGSWIVEKDLPDNNLMPVFVNGTGRNYKFDFNICLFKNFFKKQKIDIIEMVQFALLPDLKVSENPFGQKF